MKNIIYPILVLLIVSCEKSIKDFELKGYKEQIVMNALLQPDSIFKVHISKSLEGLASSIPHTFNDINLSVYKDDQFICQLFPEDSSLFESFMFSNKNIYPEPSKEYRIVASVDYLDEASCNINLPAPAELSLDDYTMKETTSILEQWESNDSGYYQSFDTIQHRWMEVLCTLKNNPDIDEYFMFAVYRYKPDINEYDTITTDTAWVYELQSFSTTDKLIEMKARYRDLVQVAYEDDYAIGNKLFVSDKLFNGKDHQFKFDGIFLEPTKYKLIVYSLTKEYYEYLQAMSRYSYELLDQLFSEKITVPTNIDNGLGMVGAMTPTVLELDFTEKDILEQINVIKHTSILKP